MTKKILRCIVAVFFTMFLILGTVVTVFASESSQYVPFESYTYWNDITGSGRKLVYNRPMYETDKVLNAADMGVESITELVDICTDIYGNVYLLDTGSNDYTAKVIILNERYKLVKEITAVYREDEALAFTGARNIYVHTDKTLYICDTENARVLQCDLNGNFIDEYTLPDSPLIPTDFSYRPVKVVADSRGYVYILSEGSYYGALLYAPTDSAKAKEFIGFYGANTITNGFLGAIQSLINRMFPNNEKKSNSSRALPFTFSDIVIDNNDFIYTATDAENKGQIKKLNPGAGNNILDSNEVNFIDDEVNRTFLETGGAFKQQITGLEIDDNEFIYALDSQYGRVFVYDSECRMITAFGGGMGNGTQEGTFQTASAIALKDTKDENGKVINDEILVSDKTNNTLTIFKRNDYGNMVMQFTKMTIDGDYLESKDGWEEILRKDKNLQVAYTGLARAYLAEGNYRQAMLISLEGYDRDTYALAYKYYRLGWVSDNFVWLFAIVLTLIAVIVVALIIISKKKITVFKNDEVKLALQTFIHPGVAFEEIKDKNKGSLIVSGVILTLFYVSAVVKVLWGGFLFTNYDPGTFNSLWVLVQSVGLVGLWVVANWLVTTLAGGKGKLKEIFIVTCYSLMPIIIERVIYIILTNFLLPTEGSFLGILSTVAMIYAGLLLTIGMLRIHDFTMTRFVGTSILTIIGMAAIIFLLILVGILLQQLGGFLMTVIIELFM